MEEQRLQSVPEMIDGNIKAEETEPSAEEKVNKEEEDDDDEEFYERIEAPKFVDFTKPNTFRTDDRYWFCSRVGCDQKHEEEINPEEISRNFVLRVLAARSPNIKLRKALNGEHSSMKCPLSAPAKPSKSRMPRLAVVSSSISCKMGDPQSKIKATSKVTSTPVVKSRQVAAKYMTTPRNKNCLPNPSSFRSVQNPKTTNDHVPKDRTVAKALVFRSPKKAMSLKKSVELQTPLTKICEGMKRLEIARQKKTLKCIKSKPKPETEDSSIRQLKICKGDKRFKDLVPSKSTKTQHKKIPTDKVVENNYGDMDVDVTVRDGSTFDCTKKEEDLQPKETSDTTSSHDLGAKMNLPNLEDKENMGSAEDHSNETLAGHGSGQMNDDGKENALNPEDNNRVFNNRPLGDKILSKETHKKNKVVQTLDKNLKGGLTSIGAGPTVVKYKKPKPTNIKPFRLRTDERGILKEATLERKLHFPAPEKEVVRDTSVIKKTFRIPKNEKFSIEQRKHIDSTSNNCGKESAAGGVSSTTALKMQMGSKPVPTTARKNAESTQQRPRSMTRLRTRSPSLQQQPQGVASPRKVGQQRLGVIKEKSSKVNSDVMVAENKTRATCAARSTSQTKRPVTIAKEPNFHSSRRPRSCPKIIV
ncbi:uncharacterized protein LOC112516626 [Cynara cardunculus var. scolymus]|uniref:Uncharacterized protein n=1 Tax=Cynara cardunculus var. scolymus TaxID=59895 RepID=A0A103XM87_CYNCS|nr:uncharacterized protein LOC112516626 [Cynara cardunculus var. scolymus]KVH93363.1 hypothetical protein Ccrd_004568 [Cynara cardunculus var. scolymus]